MSKPRLEAQSLLKRFGFDKPPFDPEFIAEETGVEVTYVEFRGDATELVHGYYQFDENKPEIFVNALDSVEEQQFTIAHELGHHVLHPKYSAGEGYVPRLKFHVDTVEEKEADEFALNLLAPADIVQSYAETHNDKKMSELFVVSPAVILKAKDLCDQS